MKNSLLVHQHLIIRAEAIKPPVDEEQLTEWMKEFVESIDMKIFMGPYVKYCDMPGNRGITAVAIIAMTCPPKTLPRSSTARPLLQWAEQCTCLKLVPDPARCQDSGEMS